MSSFLPLGLWELPLSPLLPFMISEESRKGLSALGGGVGESLQRPVRVTHTPGWSRHGEHRSDGHGRPAAWPFVPLLSMELSLWARTPFSSQAPGTRTAAL